MADRPPLPCLCRCTREGIAETDWIRTIRAAAPDLGPLDAARVAIAYLGRAKQGRDASDIDLFLAIGPWRSREAADAFDRATWGSERGGPFSLFADTASAVSFLSTTPDGTDHGRWILGEDGPMTLEPGQPDTSTPQEG